MDKHSSLSRKFVNYGEKSFIKLVPGAGNTSSASSSGSGVGAGAAVSTRCSSGVSICGSREDVRCRNWSRSWGTDAPASPTSPGTISRIWSQPTLSSDGPAPCASA
jgi:hypothetical protein